MTKKQSPPGQFSPQEAQLIEQLREHPDLMERFQTILQLSSNAAGPIKSADEVEALLIAEMRRLGNTTMESWAARAEERLGRQFKEEHPAARARKKNAEMVVCVWGGQCHRTGLEHRSKTLRAFAGSGHWRQSQRTLGAAGAGVDRFWLRAFVSARGLTGVGTLRF